MRPDPKEAVDWLSLLGVLHYASPGHLTHAPVALTPYSAPSDLLEHAATLTPPFQWLMHRIADRYPWELVQQTFPLTADGITAATTAAGRQECLKATIVPGT